ncbi:YdcH family protein [Neptuniibacter pectenicola]|uniref:YdcH family protein n=1 Tax=Neptuniibacter pectenicola TaxID=1806669 RepID=UPI0030EEF197|tara:strand:- start:2408 stop:2644 length:237 start_codon:yes stop_codon:yes gene_type:complete
MPIEHHALINDFPEYRERIHDLKMKDDRFARLMDEYHELTKHVEHMESEIEAVSTQVEGGAKIKRLKLKDELYAMLQA